MCRIINIAEFNAYIYMYMSYINPANTILYVTYMLVS